MLQDVSQSGHRVIYSLVYPRQKENILERCLLGEDNPLPWMTASIQLA
jgi:hypothetical protein